MANTYIKIASIDVGAGGASTMEFTSIPSTYTDLVLKFSGRDNVAAVTHNIQMIFNNSSTGYSNRYIYADGSTTGSGNSGASSTWMQGTYLNGTPSTANNYSNIEIYIPGYAGNKKKSATFFSVVENNGTSGGVSSWSGLWSNTAAITSIKFTSIDGGTTSQFSSATLYGIKNS
jgi:hypothetical protein